MITAHSSRVAHQYVSLHASSTARVSCRRRRLPRSVQVGEAYQLINKVMRSSSCMMKTASTTLVAKWKTNVSTYQVWHRWAHCYLCQRTS